MPGKPYPPDLLRQAARILDAWSRIDAQMTFGPLNAEALTDELNQAQDLHVQLISLTN